MRLTQNADRVGDLAREGYEAYAESSGNKNFQGNPMPTWDELPEPIRHHWRAAAARILARAD